MIKGNQLKFRVAEIVIILLMLLVVPGCSEKGYSLTATCPSVSSERVYARATNNGWILDLPGFWDLSAVTLELDGSTVISLGDDGQQFRTGETSDLSKLIGTKMQIKKENGRLIGDLTILQGSMIPALFLNVDKEKLKEINQNKEKTLTEGWACYYEESGFASYDGEIEQLKGHGNITFAYPKKPYQLKLKQKASLSGMAKAKTWILLANWVDISLLRNQIALDISRAVHLRYAISCTPVDVWINGDYQGLYLMTEKIQIGKKRIAITDLEEETEKVNSEPFNPGTIVCEKKKDFSIFRSYPAVNDPEDITGGYIATIEKNLRMQKNGLAGFRTEEKSLNVRIKEPTFPSTAQTEYFGQRILEMLTAILSKDGVNAETGKSYEEYLDVDSFALKFLIEDWVKNYDILGGSQYIFKDSDLVDPLIYAGPAWDYDLSFGNMREKGRQPVGPYVTNFKKDNNIYWLLYQHEEFRNRLQELWQTEFRPVAAVLLGEATPEPRGFLRSFEEYRARIQNSAIMNFKKWGVNEQASAYEDGVSFDNAVEYLKRWITKRTTWLNAFYD